jgi:hypothetical protein
MFFVLSWNLFEPIDINLKSKSLRSNHLEWALHQVFQSQQSSDQRSLHNITIEVIAGKDLFGRTRVSFWI